MKVYPISQSVLLDSHNHEFKIDCRFSFCALTGKEILKALLLFCRKYDLSLYKRSTFNCETNTNQQEYDILLKLDYSKGVTEVLFSANEELPYDRIVRGDCENYFEVDEKEELDVPLQQTLDEIKKGIRL